MQMYELKIDDNGVAGRLLAGMRELGWRLVTTGVEIKHKETIGTAIRYDCSIPTWYEKNGQRKSQAEWDEEISELYQRLNEEGGDE